MAAVSQLAQFAKGFRARPGPGIEVVVTPRYQIQLIPDFPIAGPNHAAWIRCAAGEADEVIREVKAVSAERGLPFAWIVDPETEPADFADHLQHHGIAPDPHGESSVMILAADVEVAHQEVPGLAISDALADFELFLAAEACAGEAFADVPFGEETGISGGARRRFEHNLAAGNRHVLLATLDGEPAGSGSLHVQAPGGAMMNGGAVRPRFRGVGVYRALVAARLDLARRAGVPGVVVWAGEMSRPILDRLGFETVSWRKFYI